MLKKIGDFYLRHRMVILITIVVFFGLQVVNTLVRGKLATTPSSEHVQVSNGTNTQIKSFQTPISDPKEGTEEEPNGWFMWGPVLFISVVASLIYLFQNWRGIDRFFPGYILMRAGIVGSKRSGHLKWQISLSNRKSEAITFSEPILVFSSFKDKKRFKINSSDYSKGFPITLAPKTNHTLVIELNQFYQRHPQLTKYRFIRTEITASNGKIYKSLYKIIVVKMA